MTDITDNRNLKAGGIGISQLGGRDAMVVLNSKADAILEGIAYTGQWYDAAVATNAPLNLCISTGSKDIAFAYEVQSNKDYLGEFRGSCSFGASGGTTLTLYNRNCESTNSASVSIKHSATIVASGTLRERFADFSTNSYNIITSSGREHNTLAFILEKNNNYLLRVDSQTAGAKMLVRLDIIEHT